MNDYNSRPIELLSSNDPVITTARKMLDNKLPPPVESISINTIILEKICFVCWVLFIILFKELV